MIDLKRFAKECDEAIFSGDKTKLHLLITSLEKEFKREVPDTYRCYAHYFMGNLHSKLAFIAGESASGWRNENYPTNLTAEINHLRQAQSLLAKGSDHIKNEIQTNLANALAHQRRSIEVLNEWNCDFDLMGDAPFVSSTSKASELIWISYWLDDTGHANLYRYEAFALLKQLQNNLDKTNYTAIREAFEKRPEFIEILKREDYYRLYDGWAEKYNDVPYKTDEKTYRAWCLQNRLFANPINDITTEWIADRDVLQFPSHIVAIGDGPFFAAGFSALKREYCFARFLAFEGMHGIHPVYENEQLFLVDTLDIVDYSGGVEKLKTSFRICFSVLDSIANLMNAYFMCQSTQVAFTSKWFKDHFKESSDNPFIDALFWLSCDLFDNDKIIADPIKWKAPNPASSDIRRIRYSIEHSWLRVSDMKSSIWKKRNDYAHTLSSKELKIQTLFVLRLVRSAMLYFCLAVTYNEKQNLKFKAPILPNPVPMIDDI